MRTTIILAAAVAALTSTSTIGMAQEPVTRTFVHQGYTYVYTASDAPRGGTLLTGHRLPGGEKFRLRVQGNRVTGRSGEAPVSFHTVDAKGAANGVVAHSL